MMNNQVYRFCIGEIECTIVSDGTYAYPHPAEILFASAPGNLLEKTLHPYGINLRTWSEYVSPYPCLVADTGDHRLLIDTGAGNLAHTTGKLRENLRLAGINDETIDIVIITHAHPDHIGGCINSDGKPAFPHARYMMSKKEWDFWSGEPDLSHLPVPPEIRDEIIQCARKCLPPIRSELELIDTDAQDELEIVPGIRLIPATGHTPGQIAAHISSAGEQLLCLADLLLHPIHVERPDWYAAVDYSVTDIVETRREFLNRAAVEKILTFVFHFPPPGLGYIMKSGNTWRWETRHAAK